MTGIFVGWRRRAAIYCHSPLPAKKDLKTLKQQLTDGGKRVGALGAAQGSRKTIHYPPFSFSPGGDQGGSETAETTPGVQKTTDKHSHNNQLLEGDAWEQQEDGQRHKNRKK